MATKKWYTVIAERGLNLREKPSKKAKILGVLEYNARIEADNSVKAPEGWIAIKDGGFVIKDFVK